MELQRIPVPGSEIGNRFLSARLFGLNSARRLETDMTDGLIIRRVFLSKFPKNCPDIFLSACFCSRYKTPIRIS